MSDKVILAGLVRVWVEVDMDRQQVVRVTVDDESPVQYEGAADDDYVTPVDAALGAAAQQIAQNGVSWPAWHVG